MSDQPFRDAEAWLAQRGVRRDPIRVAAQSADAVPPPSARDRAGTPRSTQPDEARTTSADDAGAPPAHEGSDGDEDGASAPVTAREATRLAAASADETLRRLDEAHADPGRRTAPRLEDDVAEAVAFARRSTAGAPQAEARIAGKLRERGWAPAVVEAAMDRCRQLGIVDDAAMAAALVEEGRRKGHAATRLRADLRRRDLSAEAIEEALAGADAEDPEAAAFAVAKEKAERLTGVSAETAFRRVVGHLARRGHPEALARKVARAAVFDARDPERTAGH